MMIAAVMVSPGFACNAICWRFPTIARRDAARNHIAGQAFDVSEGWFGIISCRLLCRINGIAEVRRTVLAEYQVSPCISLYRLIGGAEVLTGRKQAGFQGVGHAETAQS